MRYEMRITAYDMMDKIHIVLTVCDSGPIANDCCKVVLRHVETVQGEGESEPSAWARDVLVAALEAL